MSPQSIFASGPEAPPVVEVVQLRYDDNDQDEFPDGLRLSEPCLCATLRKPRMKDDPESPYREVDEWIEARGHGFERIVAEFLRAQGHVVLREVTVPWEHGEGHIDLLITSGQLCDKLAGGGPMLVELKANKEGRLDQANVAQVDRQLRAVERAVARGDRVRYKHYLGSLNAKGMEEWEWREVPIPAQQLVGIDARVWIIDPYRWQLRDGYEGVPVVLTPEKRVAIDTEFDTIDRYMTIIDQLDLYDPRHWPECSDGKCWPAPESELPDSLYNDANEYLTMREEEVAAEAAKKLAAQRLREGLKARRQYLGLPPHVGSVPEGAEDKRVDERGRRWKGADMSVLEQRDGKLKVTRLKEGAQKERTLRGDAW